MELCSGTLINPKYEFSAAFQNYLPGLGSSTVDQVLKYTVHQVPQIIYQVQVLVKYSFFKKST